MGKCFGPMRGAYDGAYPEKDESFRLLQDSGVRLPDGWSPEALGLPPEANHNRLKLFVWEFEREDPVRTADYLGQTLVVGNGKQVMLVARSTGQVYAVYDSSW